MGAQTARSPYLDWVGSVIGRAVRGAPDEAAGERDLVLGYATGYDAADVAVFVRSLRAVHDGPVVLVTDPRPELTAFLADYGVETARPQVSGGWRPHPVVARFAAFDALMDERPWARNVLLSDVRDVVFQGRPFEPAPRRAEFYVEHENGLSDHAFNMKYLLGLGGRAMARALADRPCVCVGTVMGPREPLIRLCRTLLMLAAVPRSGIGGAFGADQAACNIAVHLGLVEGEVKPNFGRVATIGLCAVASPVLEGARILNPDGSVSPIVHQYDRHPALAEAMHAKWGWGLETRERRRTRTLSDRARRLRDSVTRRLPELR